ncbi:TetR/AcrR family transcriptional regulator [Pseudonocardia spirodelae]|uniref:TetR/AcrR family transcriptional regulator n=1 Tax=Pseudonocardia spirodelae TaxID=3133431 RepID=A0ABU8T5Q1_9PSEU
MTRSHGPGRRGAAAERRAQILHAAVRVIAVDGVRGLRVEKLAAEAGVSTALIYYHFTNRDGLLRAALEHVNERAEAYTAPPAPAGHDDPRARIAQMLLLELQDSADVRTTSVAWGELRASAVFDAALRDPLRDATRSWDADVATLVRAAQAAGTVADDVDPELTAEWLTALVEGLSERWHSGTTTLDRARLVLERAVADALRG